MEHMTAAKYNKLRTETPDQIALAEVLDRIGVLWFHVPNEGKRNPITAHLLKLQGLKPGAPDNFIFNPPPNIPHAKGAAIELKRLSGGKVSSEQEKWIFDLMERGWVAMIAEGLDEALNALKKWGYIK